MKKRQYDNLEERIDEIKQVLKTEQTRRMFERYQTVLLHLKGYSNLEIAEITDRTNITIGSYVNTYIEAGIPGLKMDFSPGAERRLTPEQEQQLEDTVLEQTPASVGLKAQMNWTAPLIREWVKREFNVEYKDRAITTILHRRGLSHTRPTYTLANASVEKQEAFRDEFTTLKKTRKWRHSNDFI